MWPEPALTTGRVRRHGCNDITGSEQRLATVVSDHARGHRIDTAQAP